MDEVVGRIEDTVAALLARDLERARVVFEGIDRARLFADRARDCARALARVREFRASVPRPNVELGKGRRDSLTEPQKEDLFRRDNFTCRYAHCQRKTIHHLIFRAISNAFPDLQPYHAHWKGVGAHILLWMYSPSVEHHVAVARGGTRADDNLITACYQCNDLKKARASEELGWEIAPRTPSAWDGLSGQIAALKAAGY